jgi:hypothetical protein
MLGARAVQKLKDGAAAPAAAAEIKKYFGRAARLCASNKPLERDGVTLARLS